MNAAWNRAGQGQVYALLAAGTQRLQPVSATPRLDAELLLAHALGWSRARVVAEPGYQPERGQVATFSRLLKRRANLEPVAYLVGHREFYGLDLLVDERVLIPRPETEHLVELACSIVAAWRREARSTPITVADIGTGSGAIAIALAAHLPACHLYATDLSPDALELAALNIAHHHLEHRITRLCGDMLGPLPHPVDLIVSNPPYTLISDIDAGVRRHEPHLALDGGPDGLAAYRRLLAQAPGWLRPGGAVVLEIGAEQGAAVASLARAAFPDACITIHRDLAGHERNVTIVR